MRSHLQSIPIGACARQDRDGRSTGSPPRSREVKERRVAFLSQAVGGAAIGR